jgi:hypothetical protein
LYHGRGKYNIGRKPLSHKLSESDIVYHPF